MPLPHNHGQLIEHNFDHMPETKDFQAVSEIFKQLDDSSRMRISGCSAIAKNALLIFPL